jgi:Na+/proline symporter
VYPAYEYLERRFDAKTRSLTSLLFLLSRGMSVGAVVSAPAVVLSLVLGWDLTVTSLAITLPAVIYTMFGGVQAVTWTDVKVMALTVFGLCAVIATAIIGLPDEVSVTEGLGIAAAAGRLQTFDFSFDITNQYTFWSGTIAAFFLFCSYFGTDQSQVQRYLTARSLRQSRLSLIFNAFFKVPMQVFILAIGVLLYVFYHFERPPLVFNPAEVAQVQSSPRGGEFGALEARHMEAHSQRRTATLELVEARDAGGDLDELRARIARHDDELAALRVESKALISEVRGASSNDVNYVFPSYLITYVPAGVLGLLIAVIFAAAMSSLDSELTALSSATVIDFYQRYFKADGTDGHYLRVSRLVTLMWGVFAVMFALYAGRLGSLIEAVNQVGSIFYGSLLGVFLLAFLVERATATGAFLGLITALLSVIAVSLFTEIAWLWYNVVGTAIVLLVGFALRGPAPGQPRARAV